MSLCAENWKRQFVWQHAGVSMVLPTFPGVGMVLAGECEQGWERVNVGYTSEEPSAENW